MDSVVRWKEGRKEGRKGWLVWCGRSKRQKKAKERKMRVSALSDKLLQPEERNGQQDRFVRVIAAFCSHARKKKKENPNKNPTTTTTKKETAKKQQHQQKDDTAQRTVDDEQK